MPRLPRISIEEVLYYITCKAPREQRLFQDDDDYRTYLDLLRKTKENNHFKLFAYALMDNHLHLLLELEKGGNISEIMQGLNTAYTKYYNGRYNRKGHVLHGRFKATYVEKEAYLLKVTRHIHLNPSKLDPAASPEDFPYSSSRGYIDPRSGALPDRAPNLKDEIRIVLDGLAGEDKQTGYREFLASADEKESERIHKALRRGGFLGSKEFVERIREEIEARSKPQVTKTAETQEEVAPSQAQEKRETEEDIRARWTPWLAPIPRGVAAVAAGIIIVTLGITGFYFYSDGRNPDSGSGREVSEAGRPTVDTDRREVALDEAAMELKQKEIELNRKEAEMSAHLKARLASLETQARRSLNGSVWTIRVTGGSGKGSKQSYEDRLKFERGRVRSEKFGTRGYVASNYSIRMLADGETVVWETMQRNKSKGMVYWKGELRGDKMSGVVAVRTPSSKAQNFSFSSENMEVAL